MSIQFLNPAITPDDSTLGSLPELAKPIEPKPVSHRFGGYYKDKNGQYKNPLSTANLIIFPYPKYGEGLRFNPIGEGKKDFQYRELLPGFSKASSEYASFDKAYTKKLSGKTWEPYRSDDVINYAVGKGAMETEGETDAESIRVNTGLVTVTFAGGMWSQDKVNEQCQMLKDAGLSFLVYWGDDDTTGIHKANQVRYGCALAGLPCVVLNARKFFPQLPEWTEDEKGELNGSGWGAADYFKHNKVSPEEFINTIQEQIADAAKQPLEPVPYPVKPGSKGNKKSSSHTSSKKSSKGDDRTPEEKQARKNRIANGEHLLRDFISDRAWTALVNGSPSGTRHEDYPHLCWELWESYNYLLALGVETDQPQQLLNEWFKNSSLYSGDASYDKAQACLNDNADRLPNDSKKKTIENLLAGKEVEAEANKDKFKVHDFAPRTSPKVLANPKADDFYNRGLTGLAHCKTNEHLPLVICSGNDNGQLLADHGYLVASLPDEVLQGDVKDKYGFSYEANLQLKVFLYYLDNGKLESNNRDVYFVDNAQHTTEHDTELRLLKLVETGSNVFVITDKDIFSKGIEAFHDAYANALPYVAWKTQQLTSTRQKPDLILTGAHYPKELIRFPDGNKNAAYSGFMGTGKTNQMRAQVDHNTKEGFFTLVIVSRKRLQTNLAKRLNLPTIEDLVANNGITIPGMNLGCVLCIDSIIKAEKRVLLPLGYLDPTSPKFGKFRAIIEECEQTLEHYALGTGTHINIVRAAAVESFSRIMIKADHCLRIDAHISQITADYIQELRPYPEYIVHHPRTAKGQSINIWDDQTPIEMVHLAIGKIITARPDVAVMNHTLSGDDGSKWITDNFEKIIEGYTSDRKVSRFDSETLGDPNHENYNLLSESDGDTTKLDTILEALSSQKGVGIANSVFSTGVDIKAQFDVDCHIAPAVGSPLDVVQKLHRIRNEKETHLWIMGANTKASLLGGSVIPSVIKKYLDNADNRIKFSFAEKGDLIDDVPYNGAFDNLRCSLAARQNFFSRKFKAATLAILKYKWEYTIVDKSDYIESHSGSHPVWNYGDNEVSEYNLNESELKKTARDIHDEHITTVNTRIAESYLLSDDEFEKLSKKYNRTKPEEALLIRKRFDNEFQGSVECSAQAIADYKDFKHTKLQNQYYFLNPELDHLKDVINLEKSVQEGKRVRDGKLLKKDGVNHLRELGFKQFFDELYTLTGKNAVPFDNIKWIPEKDFKYFIKKITVKPAEALPYEDQYILNLSGEACLKLAVAFGELTKANQCRSMFGFNANFSEKGGVLVYSTLKLFLENYWIDLEKVKVKEGDKEHTRYYFTLEADRDLYFQVLNERNNIEVDKNKQFNKAFELGCDTPISTTGKHMAAIYKADNTSESLTLLQAIAKSKAKGLPKTQPKDSKLQLSRQLSLNLETPAQPQEIKREVILPEEVKQPAIGDYAFANGMIVKLISEATLGIGQYTQAGYEVEALNNRKSKIETAKIQPASAEVLANHINAKLTRYPEDFDKFLRNVRIYLPDKYESVLNMLSISVAA